MKITLSINAVLDDIYADSALGAIMGLRDAARLQPLLTPDHRRALLRMAVQGAAHVCSIGELTPRITALTLPNENDEDPTLTLELRCDSGREPSSEAIIFHLSAAISAATLHLLALTRGDIPRADHHSTLARLSIITIATILSEPRPFTTRMNWG